MTDDHIVLTIPGEGGFEQIAHLVLGGVGARSNLTYESLDDLEVAVESLLERIDNAGEVTVSLRVDDDSIHAAVGPFTTGALRRELERDGGEEMGLRRVLQTVVDGFGVGEREDGDWVEVTKHVSGGGRAA